MTTLEVAFVIFGPIAALFVLVGFAACVAAKRADDQLPYEPEQMDWPEFKVRRVDHHAQRSHAVLCGKGKLPDRRASR